MQRIAIIGIGCRFPGGVVGPASYWSLLTQGRCAIREIPADRWSLAGFHDARIDLPDRSYARWGGFLDDIRGFDPVFFGLSPREAEAMDPQQRLLLQVACEAAADARLPIAALRAARAGVFVGVSNVDYALLQRYRPGMADIQAGTGTALSIVANRVSNRLDLSGPSLGVDTACSSSLVAVDAACRHLSDGTCDMALAAGVNILLDPRMFVTFSRAHMLSPTGRIRAFDVSADGFVRGEGVGVVLLRRIDDALAAGDRIYAVIEATGVNQDGRTSTITEPSPVAQRAMLESVVTRAGIAPGDVDYVEAHGTGTPVGDPIEANAIGAVLGGEDRAAPLLIGSAKTNIGHLEPASGIAGLIKAALVLHRGEVPPSLGFERANPAIDFHALRLEVPREMRPLPQAGRAHHALVNSFGFGGTNACAVLSSAFAAGWVKSRCAAQPRIERDPAFTTHDVPALPGRPRIAHSASGVDPAYAQAPIPVPLSGPTPRHLQALAAALAREIDGGALADRTVVEIAAALAAQRDDHEHRAVVIARNTAELAERLACLAEGREWPQAERHAPPQIIRGTARGRRKLCFTMTGQGGQWWAMGRELIERDLIFRAAIEKFDGVFRPVGGWSVMEVLLADEASSRIDDAAITPAVMFAFQTALAQVWRARGVTPDIVLGHSFGEVTAAYLAGGLKAAEIARLVDQRGLIRHRVDRVGTMAAIGLGAGEIAPLLPADGSIEIGGYNSPAMVTLTGEENAIDALIARLNAEDPTILTRKLALDFAYHSSWFEPVEHFFKAVVGTLSTAPPKLPVISTVTGQLNDRFDTDYWWQNLRRPVRYQQGIETALELGADVFVELGPHRTLSSMTAACAAAQGREIATVTSLDRRWGDLVSLAVGTGQLWTTGTAIDWASMLGDGGRAIELPPQPWLNQPLWLEPDEAAAFMRPTFVHPLLGRRDNGPGHGWTIGLSLATHAWLGDHRLDGACVFPAAAYLEMLSVAARVALGAEAIELSDVAFPAALFIGSDDEVQLVTRYVPERRKLTIHSRLRGAGPDWELRSEATILAISASSLRDDAGKPSHAEPCSSTRLLPLPGATPIDVAGFYKSAADAGYGWGPQFQGLTGIARLPGAARGTIAVVDDSAADDFLVDPRVVDSALQLMLASGATQDLLGVMPAGIKRMIVVGSPGRAAIALGRTRKESSGDGISADIEIAGLDGSTAVRIDQLRARRRTLGAERSLGPKLYVETFEPLPPALKADPPSHVLLVAHPDSLYVARITIRLAERGVVCECIGIDDLTRRLGQAQRDPASTAATENDGSRSMQSSDSASRLDPAYVIVLTQMLDVDAIGHSEIAAAAGDATRSIIALGRILSAGTDAGTPVRLVVLTKGARACGPEEAMTSSGLAQAPVLAAARTIAMEVPALHVGLIDCEPHCFESGDQLVEAITVCGEESEIAIRGGCLLVPRIEEMGARVSPPPRMLQVSPRSANNFALRHEGSPGADGLYWQETLRSALRPTDVRIEVSAVGLNFRDLMAVSGLLPAAAEPSPAIEALGLEFSGTVVEVGADVVDLKLGDHVLGMGRGALSRYAVVSRLAVARAPDGLSHIEAATVPSAYMTAHYALNEIARLRPGETVLVHSATGGIGLAGIALAKCAGARIVTTAGTHERRAHLRELGVEHVFDSRSPSFVDGVMRATEGRGVDIVLNALSGPFIDSGLACLAPYGRFIELGKRDIHENTALGLRAMRSNISFHVVDVAALISDRPVMMARLLGEVIAMLNAGDIAPLPAQAFEAHATADAFRHFASGQHVGKLVVSMNDAPLHVRSGVATGSPLDADGTYLVTGGAQGFGLAVAQWLAARGAGRVVVASRRGASMAQLPAPVAHKLDSVCMDVTSADDVEHVLREIVKSGKPLRGIIHAAVVYEDALLSEMDGPRIDRVLAPKVTGALNLTRAVERMDAKLDFFVTFSSLAQVVGWPGQSNYAAANGFLEALAYWQRVRGIPGQCINWGALGESGHVARSDQMQRYLASSGWIGVSNAAALDALAWALDLDVPVITIAAADWTRLAEANPALARAPRMSRLVRETGARVMAGRPLNDLDDHALDQATLELVKAQTARVLRTAVSDIAPEQTLAEAGIDSLSSFELHNRIEQEAGVAVPLARYAKARRIADLSLLLASLVREVRDRAAS